MENAFGILSNRFRVFRAPIPLAPEKVEKIVLCACSLHNLMRMDTVGVITENSLDNCAQYTSFLPLSMDTKAGNHSSLNARAIREEFTKYFISSGQVPWQYSVISEID